MSGNLVCLCWVGDGWFPETEESTDEGQGDRYTDPEKMRCDQ